ncbi:MAG: TonB-dependent receptor domain-containing protein [Sphingorhabdus sp.]
MRKLHLISATALAMSMAMPAFAQSAPQAEEEDAGFGDEIVVTAQRQAQSLQDVPIAVSAFDAAALDRQQIENSSDLQLTLPNVTFSKGNFTASSFTIRGIGDLCVGVSCDSATAIHLDGTPLLSTRLFETEFFDLERIEVLRGPQGTLFGRNATSGVVNIIPARPDLNGFAAAGEAEYGNFNSIKAKAMVNLALGDKIGIRLAGFYLKRDGYTENLFDGSDIDGRDMYALRGSLRFQPTETTTIDLMAYYFREDDDRARIQKQACQRDPTGVLGCLPNRRDFGITNNNTTFVGTLTSREFFRLRGLPAGQTPLTPDFSLGSLYGPDAYAGFVSPANVRQVRTDFNPEYFADEEQYQARIDQELGNMNLQVTGFYHRASVDSRQDYNQSVQNRALLAPALTTLQLAGSGAFGAGLQTYLQPVQQALIPNGAAGNLCTSETEPSGVGSYAGLRLCSATPQDFDRSNQTSRDWSVETILSSDFDGPFNFLLGGIYADFKMNENSYYVNAFGIDYVTGILGSFTALGAGLPPSFLGTPFFRSNTDQLNVKSYGFFGEGYYDFNDKLKLTLGLRYNNDKKFVRARTTLASFLVPYGSTDAFSSPFVGSFDADPGLTGNQLWQERRVKFDEFTGRAVLDYKITEDNLVYASYSRGYKSGGINPPLSPVFAVEEAFDPELVNAFEIGSKNSFGNGMFNLNATAFYYKYKGLQLSRIVARTSVNDNVDADIYGLELEGIIRPDDRLTINMGFSYLNTKVSEDKLLGNPRDPSGGRSDAVIIKDITNGANCAVVSNSGSVAGVNGFVNQVNTFINTINAPGNPLTTAATGGLQPGAGLQPTTAFPSDSGLSARGAFSVCGILQSLAASPVGTAFGGITVENAGVPVNIKGNKLPQAPSYKWNVGLQHTTEFNNGMKLVPRLDLIYVGDSYGNIFNGRVNKINGYTQINAQIQLSGADDKWFLRGFIQNLANSNAITGLYVTDQSSGLFTNIFTLDPRRYGIAAGFKF